jgi:hypothetical protein
MRGPGLSPRQPASEEGHQLAAGEDGLRAFLAAAGVTAAFLDDTLHRLAQEHVDSVHKLLQQAVCNGLARCLPASTVFAITVRLVAFVDGTAVGADGQSVPTQEAGGAGTSAAGGGSGEGSATAAPAKAEACAGTSAASAPGHAGTSVATVAGRGSSAGSPRDQEEEQDGRTDTAPRTRENAAAGPPLTVEWRVSQDYQLGLSEPRPSEEVAVLHPTTISNRTQHSQEETTEADGLADARDGTPPIQAKSKAQRRRQAKARATKVTKATQAAAALTAEAARLGCTESELEDDDGSLAWEANYGSDDDDGFGGGYGDGQDSDGPENYDGYDVN